MSHEKTIGKPDAGNPHVRFDEREVETDLTGVDSSSRVRQPSRGQRQAPRHLSTLLTEADGRSR